MLLFFVRAFGRLRERRAASLLKNGRIRHKKRTNKSTKSKMFPGSFQLILTSGSFIR
ncbi:Uncharacterized protein dnm_063980 [Desulfonema magnum]|uniref:Uncharacterized protein n=1 Tax=Desulfonema magnum TaxID=45655 RepID=A0A975BRF4_9BACT|nr:Uncharacterized protein dnm_063980 [Desulfonema magnum]